MACEGENFGKIDFSDRYRPKPRLHAPARQVVHGSCETDSWRDSGKGFGLSRHGVTWQVLAVAELPLLAILFLVFSISVLVSPDFEMRASGVSVPLLYACPFFALTGIPCLFCGMTRSFLAMGGLDVSQSLSYHPLGPALFVILAGLAVALAISVITRSRIHVSIGKTLRQRLITGSAMLLLGAWLVKVIVWRQTGLI
ncbi:MAG: DUF2752 domain-containing protein [Thermoleophilia bacterium]